MAIQFYKKYGNNQHWKVQNSFKLIILSHITPKSQVSASTPIRLMEMHLWGPKSSLCKWQGSIFEICTCTLLIMSFTPSIALGNQICGVSRYQFLSFKTLLTNLKEARRENWLWKTLPGRRENRFYDISLVFHSSWTLWCWGFVNFLFQSMNRTAFKPKCPCRWRLKIIKDFKYGPLLQFDVYHKTEEKIHGGTNYIWSKKCNTQEKSTRLSFKKLDWSFG